MSLAIQAVPQFLPSGSTMPAQWLSLTQNFSKFSLNYPTSVPFRTIPIWMGCPRISPGGPTKRKWRTMQAKKAKQLHKAGLAREREIYKLRKQAELRAATVELERPWERAAPPKNALDAGVEERLDDWFQKPDGLHLLSDRDSHGNILLSSSGFSPEGVGHRVYGNTGEMIPASEDICFPPLEEDFYTQPNNVNVRKSSQQKTWPCKNSRSRRSASYKGESGKNGRKSWK
ncbi:uncharacterized protein LOC127251830 [Andrographis paniculata]|uniref:uncharacterized protein LOC127251830 n=1 Tax=Andrographis paniculata TaxID=175694 RepID=UPI0021E82EE4|nr:uncharacterized protein LOC127251830 [Andrographis paniculata]